MNFSSRGARTTSLDFSFLQAEDEVIVSALAPQNLLRQILETGATLVFADVDPHNGAITRATLEAAITTGTRAVVLSELASYLPAWNGLLASTEPRQIRVLSERCEADPAQAAKRIVPGVDSIGGDLLRLDSGQILNSPAEFAASLRRSGASAQALSEDDFAFEAAALPRRYRRRDFPGAVAAVKSLLLLPGWEFYLSNIEEAAFAAYRQESFLFMQPLTMAAPLPKPVLSEGIAAGAPRAKRRLAAGSKR